MRSVVITALLLAGSVLVGSGDVALAQSADHESVSQCVQQIDDYTLKNNCDFQIIVAYFFPGRVRGPGSLCTADAPCGDKVPAGGTFKSDEPMEGASIGACKWPWSPTPDSGDAGFIC
jgi:hypothetical protein